MSLKEMLREAERGNPRVVTAPHTRWMEANEEDQVVTPKAIKFQTDVLKRKFKHPRPGRFSPSALGDCPRAVLFKFAGAPQVMPKAENQEMMAHGTSMHARWQVEGLSEGWMVQAEVWVYNKDLLCGGSMDGILLDGSIFELKTSGYWIYNNIVVVNGWPKWENLLQLGAYFILSDTSIASVVYEHRDSGKFHEFRVPRDAQIEQEVLRRLAEYRSYAQADELPEQLEMCSRGVGDVFHRCPFRKVCKHAHSVSEFGKVK